MACEICADFISLIRQVNESLQVCRLCLSHPEEYYNLFFSYKTHFLCVLWGKIKVFNSDIVYSLSCFAFKVPRKDFCIMFVLLLKGSKVMVPFIAGLSFCRI